MQVAAGWSGCKAWRRCAEHTASQAAGCMSGYSSTLSPVHKPKMHPCSYICICIIRLLCLWHAVLVACRGFRTAASARQLMHASYRL